MNVEEDDATIKFYVDYPKEIKAGSLPRAILASIVSSELEKFQNLLNYTIILNTPVTPPVPSAPNIDQEENAVILDIEDFTTAKVGKCNLIQCVSNKRKFSFVRARGACCRAEGSTNRINE